MRSLHGGGIGFAFLDARWIVTAKHVVAGQTPSEPLRLSFPRADSLPGRLFYAHPRVDLAVVEVLGDTRCAPLLAHHGEPPPGRLLCLGYKPSRGENAAACHTPFAADVESYERSARQRDGYEEILYKFSAPEIGPGCSGAPLLVPGGGVVGVVVDGITLGGQHIMRATAITPLLDRLFR